MKRVRRKKKRKMVQLRKKSVKKDKIRKQEEIEKIKQRLRQQGNYKNILSGKQEMEINWKYKKEEKKRSS